MIQRKNAKKKRQKKRVKLLLRLQAQLMARKKQRAARKTTTRCSKNVSRLTNRHKVHLRRLKRLKRIRVWAKKQKLNNFLWPLKWTSPRPYLLISMSMLNHSTKRKTMLTLEKRLLKYFMKAKHLIVFQYSSRNWCVIYQSTLNLKRLRMYLIPWQLSTMRRSKRKKNAIRQVRAEQAKRRRNLTLVNRRWISNSSIISWEMMNMEKKRKVDIQGLKKKNMILCEAFIVEYYLIYTWHTAWLTII